MFYNVQVTPEGGPSGSKRVEADEFTIVENGVVIFYKDTEAKFVLSSFVAIWTDDANVEDLTE